MDDQTHAESQLIEELRGTVQNINGTFTRLNTEALSPEARHDLRASIEHLNETTNSPAQSSKKLDGAVEKADATMASPKKDGDDLQGAMGEAGHTFAAAT